MAGILSTQPRKWVNNIPTDLIKIAAYTSNGKDAVHAKIRRALLLERKLIDELLRLTDNIQKYKEHQGHLNCCILNYSENERYAYSPSWMIERVKIMEEEMEERLFKHHGRLIKKQVSIREQDDIVRTLRHKMLHQRNTLAGEKMIIKYLKLAEDTRAKIILSDDTKIKTSDDYEYTKKDIEDYKARILQLKADHKERISTFDRLDKDIRSWETQMTKIKKMKEDVTSFVSFLSITRRKEKRERKKFMQQFNCSES